MNRKRFSKINEINRQRLRNFCVLNKYGEFRKHLNSGVSYGDMSYYISLCIKHNNLDMANQMIGDYDHDYKSLYKEKRSVVINVALHSNESHTHLFKYRDMCAMRFVDRSLEIKDKYPELVSFLSEYGNMSLIEYAIKKCDEKHSNELKVLKRDLVLNKILD